MDLNELIQIRRTLYQNAEIGFELNFTKNYVIEKLKEFGCTPIECGKCGVYTVIGNSKSNKCVMLRADMDALPIKDETDLEFKSKINMHACGHDMHTTMLLGAAKLLKEKENELNGVVKVVFQPAEELLSGAKDMIDNGILSDPEPQNAMMIHVMTNVSFPAGTLVISPDGICAAAAEFFKIIINGKSTHGSMPHLGIDPIISASNIVLALEEIVSRELSIMQNAVLTIGQIHSGKSANTIPNTAIIEGSVRCYDEKLIHQIKERINEISKNVCKAYRCTCDVEYFCSSPNFVTDKETTDKITKIYKEHFPEEKIILPNKPDDSKVNSVSGGSEDFAYFAKFVPSAMIAISAGETSKGYKYPLHHPKVKFDESCLENGSLAYYYFALGMLNDN